MFSLATLADLKDVTQNSQSDWNSGNNFVQFLVVFVLFLGVLFLTMVTTRWIARYQKGQFTNRNIEVIETYHITGSKYIQLVRVADTYMVLAVGKENVTLLKEIPKDEIRKLEKEEKKQVSFQNILKKTQNFTSGNNDGPKEE